MPLICPSCQTGHLRQRTGKYGVFWGCTHFGQGCDYTANDRDGAPEGPLRLGMGVRMPPPPCPVCRERTHMKHFRRRDKKGWFWVCKEGHQAAYVPADDTGQLFKYDVYRKHKKGKAT